MRSGGWLSAFRNAVVSAFRLRVKLRRTAVASAEAVVLIVLVPSARDSYPTKVSCGVDAEPSPRGLEQQEPERRQAQVERLVVAV